MKKLYWDIFLTAIFLLTMCFHFLPRILHEILGLVMLATIVIHLKQNFYWLKNLKRGTWTHRRIFSTLINFLLLAIFITVLVTGICMSNYLFKDTIPPDIHRNMWIHQHHVSLPYLFLILSGVHIALNRHFLLAKIPIKKIPLRMILTLSAGAGIVGSFMNRVGDRILMKHIFATPATELPFIIFFILLSGIIVFYALLTVAFEKILNFFKNQRMKS